ncbi:hypothetical protein ACO0K7_10615 [Undibacterium sp. Ji67W]|uniref:hypothetical protein n=1 Tax=Undibacterium sp. Ji67W TaxID=3413042 RepID=UPI003BF19DCC
MLNRTQITWFVFACVGLILVSAYLLFPKTFSEESNSTQSLSQKQRIESKYDPVAIEAKISMTTKSTPIQTMNPMHMEIAHATDFRALAEKFKQHPEQGGLYYASSIVKHCYAVRAYLKQPKGQQTDSSDHRQASYMQQSLTRQTSACAGFLDSELSVAALNALSDPGKGDPLFQIQTQLKERQTENYQTALSSLLESKSPELIMQNLIYRNDEGVYFDGKNYAVGSNESVLLNYAMRMALCDSGTASCDKDSFWLSEACTNAEFCTQNMNDLIQHELAERGSHPESDMQAVKMYAQKISAALLNKDINIFMPESMKKTK